MSKVALLRGNLVCGVNRALRFGTLLFGVAQVGATLRVVSTGAGVALRAGVGLCGEQMGGDEGE